MLARYPLSGFASPGLAWATVVTDSRFACPARVADALLSARVPTFAYEFDDPNAPEFIVRDPLMPLGAFQEAAEERRRVVEGMEADDDLPELEDFRRVAASHPVFRVLG